METTQELVEKDSCEYCGGIYNGIECQCRVEEREHNISKESSERLRYLISLGHPGELGEPYTRYQVMEEIQRRGKIVLIELGWPITPDAIYKNKYTGSEDTLHTIIYKYCMERELDEPFETRLDKHSWTVMEHSWPKELWVDTQMMDQYKGTLSYYKDNVKPAFSITETGDDDYEDDEDTAIGIDESADEAIVELDKAQAGLGAWLQ